MIAYFLFYVVLGIIYTLHFYFIGGRLSSRAGGDLILILLWPIWLVIECWFELRSHFE